MFEDGVEKSVSNDVEVFDGVGMYPCSKFVHGCVSCNQCAVNLAVVMPITYGL